MILEMELLLYGFHTSLLCFLLSLYVSIVRGIDYAFVSLMGKIISVMYS